MKGTSTMTDDDPDKFELDGDDYTPDDVLDMFDRYAQRPRDKNHTRKPVTLEDSVLWHGMAHLSVEVTTHEVTDEGITTKTGTAYLGRPVLGPIQEEPDDD